MDQFYVRDCGKTKYFNSIPEVVSFLEKVVELKMKMTRSKWMEHVIDLGYGADDRNGRVFTESMSEQVEVGTVQNDGKHVRCNIFESTAYKDAAYGD